MSSLATPIHLSGKQPKSRNKREIPHALQKLIHLQSDCFPQGPWTAQTRFETRWQNPMAN